MTHAAAATLAEQRLALRQRMQDQREQIALQLDPAADNDGSFPRSLTMRLLIGRPALSGKLLAGLALLLVGVRFFKS